jgi:predicted transcriptional regulator
LGAAVNKRFLFDHSDIDELQAAVRVRHTPLSMLGCDVVEKPADFRRRPLPFRGQNLLTEPSYVLKLTNMEVHLKPETASRLAELASKSGRATDDLMEDAMAGYLQELTEAREMLDSRYADIKSGRVAPIDGEAFFDKLRKREDELLKKRNLK